MHPLGGAQSLHPVDCLCGGKISGFAWATQGEGNLIARHQRSRGRCANCVLWRRAPLRSTCNLPGAAMRQQASQGQEAPRQGLHLGVDRPLRRTRQASQQGSRLSADATPGRTRQASTRIKRVSPAGAEPASAPTRTALGSGPLAGVGPASASLARIALGREAPAKASPASVPRKIALGRGPFARADLATTP